MRRLLEFISRNRHIFLFLLLETFSFFLLFGYNRYQRAVFLSSAGGVTGQLYSFTSGVTSYFSLGRVNTQLQERNQYLEERLESLTQFLEQLQMDSLVTAQAIQEAPSVLWSTSARVVKNSINKADNYVTLNKGSKDGVTEDMGVMDARGVVGVVFKTSDHYSIVLSLLSSKSNLSCKIASNDYFGYLRWEGADSRHAYLVDLPRHAEVNVGDSVVTSGYSDIFPEDILVGVVDKVTDAGDGLSYDIRVRLACDFDRLRTATIIYRKNQNEIRGLQPDK